MCRQFAPCIRNRERGAKKGCKLLSTNANKGMQTFTAARHHWKSYGVHPVPAKNETELDTFRKDNDGTAKQVLQWTMQSHRGRKRLKNDLIGNLEKEMWAADFRHSWGRWSWQQKTELDLNSTGSDRALINGCAVIGLNRQETTAISLGRNNILYK